ncbi:alcohol dehydrogenase [Telmatospirillum siberiense]|uniref:Alcohol dehydrogenase n=2 Tax=Telmatospirillum siberiense TaxID=382514 RepID=A0A2N3PXT7_9PROT|nr:alcohol dehydrogenase [Telmatospirillum siberiense]
MLIRTGILAVIVIVVVAFFWFVVGPGPLDFAGGKTVAIAAYSGANPTGVPVEFAKDDLVTRGRYLTQAADCQACHTTEGGLPFAGGRAFKTPFGTLYSPNITPDRETGIGTWTDADLLQAIHQGISRDGTRLYPAFPYAAYTYLADADVLAIKAYLFSLPAVHNAPPANSLAFPYNQRWLMAIWSFLYNPDQRFQPNAERSPEWNRGAYLAEALGHCGDCHTPRNRLQALDNHRKFAGTVVQGWRAYNITGDQDTGVGAWNNAELTSYLSTGHATGRGTASGPMAEAVDLSLAHLSATDHAAIVAYLRSVPAIPSPDLPAPKAEPAPAAPKLGTPAGIDSRGQKLFAGACAGCHDWTGVSPLSPLATLTGGRAVNDPSAANVAQIILLGALRQTIQGVSIMPAFGSAYSDVEIAALANYVVARFGAKPSAITAEEIAELRRMQ